MKVLKRNAASAMSRAGLATAVALFVVACGSGTSTTVTGGSGGGGGGGSGGGSGGGTGGGSGDGSGSGGGSTPVIESRYALANDCFALRSLSSNRYAVLGGDGTYAASSTSAVGGEALYAKPTALGEYLFYARNRSFLATSGTGVGSASAPSDAVVWIVDRGSDGAFSLVSKSSGKPLGVDGSGQLVQAAAAGSATRFTFERDTRCTAYPEMPLDVTGAAYKGRGVDQPVIGFADAHTHMAMSSEMSDGSGNAGPSAGGVLYGQPFNRFGVPEALKNCEAFHGPLGVRDAEFVLQTGAPDTHDTEGWPGFVGWPVGANFTHQGMYYRWVERAYRSGLRLMVNLGTNIEALCEVGRTAFGQPGADCNDMNLGVKQLEYSYAMQDYIDAQEGGPGQGWFRIVRTPSEARAVINDGKLAVVLGLEFSNLFDCDVTFNLDGSENRGCDTAQIDAEIDRIWDLGARQIYLLHDVNSAIGGTGLFTFVLNLVGFYGTQRFWDTYDCPDGGEGETYFYSAGFVSPTAPLPIGSDPITSALLEGLQGTLPTYGPARQCNSRGLTDLGQYALTKAMQKGFVLDIDHAELTIKQDMIDMAKAQTPGYPLVSMHGGHGGITMQQARDILDLGGVIFPYHGNGRDAVAFLEKLKTIQPAGRPLALGYGLDGNGFGGMAPPRGAGAQQIEYPFTLFQGAGWGPQFAAAGIEPVTVDLLTIPESGKFWNADEVGRPHYGLVADYVEEVRIEGGEEAVTALFNSAEAYLQMWEKTVNR